MKKCFSIRRIGQIVMMTAAFFTAPVLLRAEIYPTSTIVSSRAHAWIGPNPIDPPDIDSTIGLTGDFVVSTHAFDDSSAALSCEVSASTNAHVAADALSGNATIHIDWHAVNTVPPGGNPPPTGSFEGEGVFEYSFIADTPFDITINVTTTSNANGSGNPAVVNAMAINHEVRFLGAYTTLDLNDSETLSYTDLPPGFYQVYVVHFPNSGISPWPDTHPIADTNLSFTIVPDPPPPPTPGDLNCDTVVDVNDIAAMVLALLDPGLYLEFHGCIENGDLNGDDLVDGLDLRGFVDLLTP